MQFEDFKRYIDSVKDNPRFKEIAEFTKMTSMNPKEDIYNNIKGYLGMYYYKQDTYEPDYEKFVSFLDYYLKGEIAETVIDEDGYIDLTKTPNFIRPCRYCNGKGNFFDNQRLFSDGSKYIAKLPLNYMGNSGVSNKYCLYAPLIASQIAKKLEVTCAEISLAKAHNGNRVLSKNFLKQNEEIVTYAEDEYEVTISEQLNKLEEALKLRKFSDDEIEQTKLEFLKQEFVAKIIELKDQTTDNSPIIISVDENGDRHVKMAPMFDFDYSFHMGQGLEYMLVRECDNWKTDISSFIEQYQDYPGFMEYMTTSISKIDMKTLFEEIYKQTGLKEFSGYEGNEQMMKFIEVVDTNLKLARETIEKTHKRESEAR